MKVKFLDNVIIGSERYAAGSEADINFNLAEHLKARGLVHFDMPKPKAEPQPQPAQTKPQTKKTTATKSSAKKAVK